MKIIRLEAEGFARLTAVDITPDPEQHMIQVRGKNGDGKTSVLNAISAALDTSFAPKRPVKNGFEIARITLDLGEIVVKRRYGPGDRTNVVVEAENGARFTSPQHMLNELKGAIALDPLEFTRAKPADQLQMLRSLVPLEVDIDALDRDIKRDREKRTEINREAARLRGQASGIQIPEGLPAEPIDIDAITNELKEASAKNQQLVQERNRREQIVKDIASLRKTADERDIATARSIEQITNDIRRLQDQINDLMDRKGRILNEAKVVGEVERNTANESQAQLEALEPLADPVDAASLFLKQQWAITANRGIEERNRRATIEAEADALERRSAELTENMRTAADRRVTAIANAKMPVPGLAFGDGEVLYDGVPFSQASSAAQIQVGVALAMAAKPKLRVLCVREGSLLDDEGLRVLADAVRDNDYQLWIEKVGTDGVGIIIEDGTVAEVKNEV